jgi:hypothetical protein
MEEEEAINVVMTAWDLEERCGPSWPGDGRPTSWKEFNRGLWGNSAIAPACTPCIPAPLEDMFDTSYVLYTACMGGRFTPDAKVIYVSPLKEFVVADGSALFAVAKKSGVHTFIDFYSVSSWGKELHFQTAIEIAYRLGRAMDAVPLGDEI